jgi:hypothetical protein
MKVILSKQTVDKAIETSREKDGQIKLSNEAEKAQIELGKSDDKKEINTLLKQMDVDNEVKRREIET